jgi:hypothetical protein
MHFEKRESEGSTLSWQDASAMTLNVNNKNALANLPDF